VVQKNQLRVLNKMFIVKIHQFEEKIIVVISDKDLIGKRFEEGKLQLDLTTSFYDGKEMNETEIEELAKTAYILHLTGEKTIHFFDKMGLIDPKKILIISRIPHTEIFFVQD